MKIIGITGGIGSGKTTVCRIFSCLGVPVFSADEEAHEVYHDEKIKNEVSALLGAEVYENGQLNRKRVAEKIFTDGHLLKKLNAIIHPAVQQRFEKWCIENKDAAYVLKEAAILFESGSYKDADAVITVAASAELRIGRVVKRDSITEADVKKRMQNQWSDEDRIKHSHYVIHNDERQLAIPQVLKIHSELQGYD